MKVRVECYAGSRADERPTAVVFDGTRLPVAEVLDTWYGTDHLYFRLRLARGDELLVRRGADGDWTLEQLVAER
ncbi:MAG: hypothetical protein JXB32_26030 [Deltaproteobacteria bacterium]|nr:hypothetical protein [Deltaproteobacteria bacterium]